MPDVTFIYPLYLRILLLCSCPAGITSHIPRLVCWLLLAFLSKQAGLFCQVNKSTLNLHRCEFMTLACREAPGSSTSGFGFRERRFFADSEDSRTLQPVQTLSECIDALHVHSQWTNDSKRSMNWRGSASWQLRPSWLHKTLGLFLWGLLLFWTPMLDSKTSPLSVLINSLFQQLPGLSTTDRFATAATWKRSEQRWSSHRSIDDFETEGSMQVILHQWIIDRFEIHCVLNFALLKAATA